MGARYDRYDDDEGAVPCATGRHCAERDYQGNPGLGPRAFCATDEGRIADAIAGLPETYAQLRLLLPVTGQQEERVTGSREAPVPVNLDVQAFMRQVVHVTCSWEDQVRAAVSLSDLPEGRRRDGVALAQACRTLNAHLTALLSLPAEDKARFEPPSRKLGELPPGSVVQIDSAGDAWVMAAMDGTAAGLEFLQLHGRARGMLGLTRQRRRITEVPCDGCRAKTLVQSEAKAGGWEPVVRCTACPMSYTGASYDLLMGRVYQAQLEALSKAS
jgi:hypothetical protein